MIRVLSETDIAAVLDLEALLDEVERGLVKQARGEVERPDRPEYPVGTGLESEEPLGASLVMPAYIHGSPHFATKIVGVHEGNAERGLPTVHAQIVLTETDTGRPVAFMDGTTVTNARTGCIGGVAVRAMKEGPVTLGVLGAGAQARWQTRAIGAAIDVASVRIYSPSDSKNDCAQALRSDGFDATAVDEPDAAVEGASVVVTATTSRKPVFAAEALRDDAVVVAIGAYTREMQEIETPVIESASTVYADVPSEVAKTGDLRATDLDEADLVPLGVLLSDEDEPPTGTRVVESVGSAVLDAAAAEHLFTEAVGAEVGTELPF